LWEIEISRKQKIISGASNKFSTYKMDSNDCNASFTALPSSPILHYWGIEVVTPAKRFSVASFFAAAQ